MKNLFAVIMAGGSGTRFWPLSRRAWPKQFLSLDADGASLLQSTVRRIRPLFAPENIFVVTSDRHAKATAEQLPELPGERIDWRKSKSTIKLAACVDAMVKS